MSVIALPKLTVYWCPRCKTQSPGSWHFCKKGPELIPQLDEETKCIEIEVEPSRWHLCCVCGTITPEAFWTYWQPNPDENTEDEMPWIPSPPGSTDPMCLCPVCHHEHRDDYDSGFYAGTLDEMKTQRAMDLGDHRERWADTTNNLETETP